MNPTIEISLFDAPLSAVREGVAVRLEWPEHTAGPEWLALDHPGMRAWVDERYRAPGRARRSSIVVPLGGPRVTRVHGWSEPGAGDEGAMDYDRVTVRAATVAEAAEVLAAEQRDDTLNDLLDAFRVLTRLPEDGGMERITSPPTPGGEPLTGVEITRHHALYGERAGAELAVTRMWRHVHALTAYRLTRPGEWPESENLLRPDPAAGVVWYQWGIPGALPRCYPLTGEMATVVEGLVALLTPVPPSPSP